MPIEGVDYAWGDPGVKALKDAGKHFACRYLSTPGNTKNLRRGEAKVLRASGIDVVTVFETTANRALSGESGGRLDAHAAEIQLALLDSPKDAAVYFAVDFDATQAQQSTINAYLRGAASVIGKKRVGVYGGYWVVKRALDAGVCHYAWQTYAWSGGRWDRRAQLQQYSNGHRLNGVSVDYDRAMVADFGQWDRPKPKRRRPWPTPLPKWAYAWLRYRLNRRKRVHPGGGLS